ncbi:reverse transcriptase domain-containing protein [Tanacetum coccineum]
MKAVPSTTHRMIKFPVMGGTLTLRSSKIIPIEYLNKAFLRRIPLCQNRLEGRNMEDSPLNASERHTGVSPNTNGRGRNEEKTRSYTNQGIFCYTKRWMGVWSGVCGLVPFGLRNAGATYQRLVDKTFHGQIGRNLECTFGVEEGMFLGYEVNYKGIKICPDKVDTVLSLSSPKCLKDVHRLNGKFASLNRFLAKSAEKSLPFFKTLKKCTKKSDFLWTEEAEAAFRQMKEHIAKLPMLIAPEEQEELIVYLAASKEAVSAVLMTEREARQMPIYFVSRALRGPEVNYTAMEKLVLALVHASKILRRYFQAHPIIVITDQPIKNILSNPEVAGRMQKWSIQLGEFGIHYRPRVSVKGQVLADFIVERPEEEGQDDSAKEEEPLPARWTLFTDGSSCVDGCGAGVILTDPEGVEFTYALRFQFEATNNEAEYEALIAGLRIAEKIGVQNLEVNVDSKLVANQVNGTYIAKETDMIKYLEKVKALASTFRAFSIKQVPRSKNKKADALSKMASTSFAHLSKQTRLHVDLCPTKDPLRPLTVTSEILGNPSIRLAYKKGSFHTPKREEQTNPSDSVRTTSAVDLEEFCEKHYEKLLPIMADKYEYEKKKKEKLEEVKARLDFGDARKKSTRAQESA